MKNFSAVIKEQSENSKSIFPRKNPGTAFAVAAFCSIRSRSFVIRALTGERTDGHCAIFCIHLCRMVSAQRYGRIRASCYIRKTYIVTYYREDSGQREGRPLLVFHCGDGGGRIRVLFCENLYSLSWPDCRCIIKILFNKTLFSTTELRIHQHFHCGLLKWISDISNAVTNYLNLCGSSMEILDWGKKSVDWSKSDSLVEKSVYVVEFKGRTISQH